MDHEWVDVFPIENGDIPASYVISYVSLQEGTPWKINGWKLKITCFF